MNAIHQQQQPVNAVQVQPAKTPRALMVVLVPLGGLEMDLLVLM